MIDNAPWLLIAYFLGSISPAIILSHLYGLPDPRTQGSGNPGATNMLRVGGKKLGLMVLLADALKGFIAVWPAALLIKDPWFISLTALSVFLGHLYPIFFDFKGGKGVATYLGALLAASPLLGLSAMGIWSVVAVITRYSSLAALSMAVVIPCLAFYTMGSSALPWLGMSLLLAWRHRDNIIRLWQGKEAQLGKRSRHADLGN